MGNRSRRGRHLVSAGANSQGADSIYDSVTNPWPQSVERAALVVNPDRKVPPIRRDTQVARASRRVFDLVFATLALLGTAPLAFILAGLIKATSSGPVIYRHRRIGRNASEFDCYKFRTMIENADDALHHVLSTCEESRREFAETHKLKDDPRVTWVGRFLRKVSLDELPQFWNIIKGDMSVVGPRPIVEEEKVRYGADLPLVLSVRPGLTGLWQVSGRNDVDYEERVLLDREYVLRRNFVGDARIIAKTMTVMVRKDSGAY